MFVTTFITVGSCQEKKTEKQPVITFKYFNKIASDGILITSILEPDGKVPQLWIEDSYLKIITHGWLSSTGWPVVSDIKSAYLNIEQNYNIITVDWSPLAKSYWYPSQYHNAKRVGAVVAELIKKLVALSLVSLKKVHLIGHSVGAHVMGIAGAKLKPDKVARITGLDPARPSFQKKHRKSENVLDKPDAEFVDIIHTTVSLGFSKSLGHVDFWMNGKKYWQKNCSFLCSHGKAFNLFAESILDPFLFEAQKCGSYKLYKEGKCASEPTAFMGEATPSDTRGDYYLTVKTDPVENNEKIHPE